MGKIVRFDPRRRKRSNWAKPSAYGLASSRAPRPPRFAGVRARRGGRFNAGLVWLAILLSAFAWVVWSNFGFLGSVDPEDLVEQKVEATWAYCGLGQSRHCVVDGDTFHIGGSAIRVVGIDTPEREARCERERLKAEAARAALLTWLNEGPFTMSGDAQSPTDKYGRQLRKVWRDNGGERRSLAQAMIDAGLAREYHGGTRRDWCG